MLSLSADYVTVCMVVVVSFPLFFFVNSSYFTSMEGKLLISSVYLPGLVKCSLGLSSLCIVFIPIKTIISTSHLTSSLGLNHSKVASRGEKSLFSYSLLKESLSTDVYFPLHLKEK